MSFLGKKFAIAVIIATAINLLTFAGFAQAAGSVTIEAQKVLNGNATLSANQTTYQIKKPGTTQIIATTTSDADGNIIFSNVPFSDADILNGKYVIFEISEVAGSDTSIVYDSYVGYAIVTLEEGTSNVQSINYAKPNAEDFDYIDYEYDTYHATDAELQGVAYSVFDSRDGSLVFFRAEEGAYANNEYVYLDNTYSNYLYYTTVPEDSEQGFNYDRGYNLKNLVKSVRFKDAVRPINISFEYFSYCESFDLRKLDTSRMTNMDYMFALSSYGSTVSTINISSFDMSNVTTMQYMFYGARSLKNLIWGHQDTSKVRRADFAFADTKLERFKYDRFDTASLEKVESMFRTDGGTLRTIDFSSWRSNGRLVSASPFEEENYYDTQSIIGYFNGEYLDISSWGKVYSAEFIRPNNLKVVKLCFPAGSSGRSDVFPADSMINVETGEIITARFPEDGACGTYANMSGDSMVFMNRKKSTIQIAKTDANGSALSGATLALKMDGAIVDSWETSRTAKSFGDLEPGHSYEIVELDTPAGYRIAAPISFEVDDNGVISSGNATVSSLTMMNEEDKVEVEKVWEDDGFAAFRPETVSFDLVDSVTGEKADELTLSADNDWKGAFENFKRYGDNAYASEYKVVETNTSANYAVSYAAAGTTDFSNNPIVSNNVIVKNSFVGETIDYPFLKEWDDAGHESERPSSISFNLYEQSNPSRTLASLSLTATDAQSDNQWSGVFENLPKLDHDGTIAEYVIVEDGVSGYSTSYTKKELGEDVIDILELTCNHSYSTPISQLGFIIDNSDTESEILSTLEFSGASGDTVRLGVESSSYTVIINDLAQCTGHVIRGERSSLSETTEGEIERATLERNMQFYAPKTISRDDEFRATRLYARDAVILEKADFVPEEVGVSDAVFAGANVIINKYVGKEQSPNTVDTILESAGILTMSLGGLVVIYFSKRR
jgi:hypothetical protein